MYSARYQNLPIIMPSKPTTILAIETSCDETAVAIVEKIDDESVVLSNVVSSQIALHAPFGGVVPDLAAREHTKNILPVLTQALTEAELTKDDIDAIAVTQGPGLIPALLIGTTAAKTLSFMWQKPLLGIHHIEGHIYANFIKGKLDDMQKPEFPLLALVVSGGHTQIVLMQNHFQYEILGETQDDAVGEAFDKVAKMLGLPYPGGPVVAKRADEFQGMTELEFPRPMIHSKDFNFSFSGLKTAVLYTIRKHPEKISDENFMNEICFAFQEAAIDVLLAKTKKAIEQYQPKTFVIAGGVSANVTLRSRLKQMIAEQFPNTNFITPEFTYSLDNAAMIASAAAFRWDMLSNQQKDQSKDGWKNIQANANFKLQDL